MDSLKIKTFLLVAKHKNFSKTAEEFSYTPSAISHIADALEEEVGVKLFLRTRKGVELTESGKKLYDKFKALADAENELLKSASKLSEKRERTLKIGSFSSVALNILPDILSGFKSEYPDVKTTIMVDDYMDDWIEKQKADVILTDNMSKYKNWQPIFEEEYIAVVPACEFEGREEVMIDELYSFPFINLDEEKLGLFIDYTKFREVMSLHSIENDSALYMVCKNLGVAILPELSVRNLPKGAKTLRLSPEITRTIGISYDKTNMSFTCMQFVRYLRQYMKSNLIVDTKDKLY